MFKYKPGIKVSYERQGYIYFKSRSYNTLDSEEQSVIDKLCREIGGEYSSALFAFVTTDASATKISIDYYLSKATLYRLVKEYYEKFPTEIK